MAQLEINALASSGHEGSTVSLFNVRQMIADFKKCSK